MLIVSVSSLALRDSLKREYEQKCILLKAETNLGGADVAGAEDGGECGGAAVRDLRGSVAPLYGAKLREQRPQRRHFRSVQFSH